MSETNHHVLLGVCASVALVLCAGGATYYYRSTKTSSSSPALAGASIVTAESGLTASQIAAIQAYNQLYDQTYINAEIGTLKALTQSFNQAYIKAEVAAALTTSATGLTPSQLATLKAVNQSSDQVYIKAELAALASSATLTSNYLCPLNVAPTSGLCVSVGANGQVLNASILPYAKMTGKGAIGFNSPLTLVLPTSYLKGGMTYNASNGYVTVPWPGLYEVKCQVTLDINKQGYVSIAVNGGLREQYGRLFQSNASDATNGYVGSNTFAFAASDQIGLVLTKNGANTGTVLGNYQDAWWSLRYLSNTSSGDYAY